MPSFRRGLTFLLVVSGLLSGCRGSGTGLDKVGLPAEAVSFVTFGDWGWTSQEDQLDVASAIQQYCQEEECQFVLTLGDNFYPSGVTGTDDPQWQTKYRDVYGSLGLPFYAMLGNHDLTVVGSEQYQIDYSLVDSSWHMPGKYYLLSLPEGEEPPLLEIYVFNSESIYYDVEDFQDEKDWLQDVIDSSQATWKILALHRPMISNGPSGDDQIGLNDDLLPLICNRIDIVLSGHEHSFSHLKDVLDECNIDQLIVGTGGAVLFGVNADDPRVLSTGSFFGFGWFQITAEEMTFRMIQTDATPFYTTNWTHP